METFFGELFNGEGIYFVMVFLSPFEEKIMELHNMKEKRYIIVILYP